MKNNEIKAGQEPAKATTVENKILLVTVPKLTKETKKPMVVNVPDKLVSIVERKPKETLKPQETLFEELQIETQSDIVKELESKIKLLEEQIKHEPQSIEERLEYYKQKKELTERFEKYQAQLILLERLRENILETNKEELDFIAEDNTYCLKIVRLKYQGREDDNPFVITNPNIIDSILDVIKERMETKKDELQKEIAS